MTGFATVSSLPTFTLCLDLYHSSKLPASSSLPKVAIYWTVICYRAFNITCHKSWTTSLDYTSVSSSWLTQDNRLTCSKNRELAQKGITTMLGAIHWLVHSFLLLRSEHGHHTDLTNQILTDQTNLSFLERWLPPMGKNSTTVRKPVSRNDKSEMYLHPLFWEYAPVNDKRNWRS